MRASSKDAGCPGASTRAAFLRKERVYSLRDEVGLRKRYEHFRPYFENLTNFFGLVKITPNLIAVDTMKPGGAFLLGNTCIISLLHRIKSASNQ